MKKKSIAQSKNDLKECVARISELEGYLANPYATSIGFTPKTVKKHIKSAKVELPKLIKRQAVLEKELQSISN